MSTELAHLQNIERQAWQLDARLEIIDRKLWNLLHQPRGRSDGHR